MRTGYPKSHSGASEKRPPNPDLINLPSYRILQVEDTDDGYRIRAETKIPPTRCLHCGGGSLVGFGRRDQQIRDLPIRRKRVCLMIDTRRFRCKSCGKTFYEPLPEIDDRRSMTPRLIRRMEQESLRHPFVRLAEETGVSDITVRNVFYDYAERLQHSICFKTPEILGIDTVPLIRRPRAVLTDIRSGFVVEILENRETKTVTRYLCHLPDHNRIRWVVLGLWEPYREAVRESLPQAKIAVDPFCVVSLADIALDHIRKTLVGTLSSDKKRDIMKYRSVLLTHVSDLNDFQKKRLTDWSLKYPFLYKAYRAKEQIYNLYDASDKNEALNCCKTWEETLEPELHKPFAPLLSAFENWMEEILNSFDLRVTHTGRKAIHDLVQAEALMGRGYSFDVFRVRILLVPHGAQRNRNRSDRSGTGAIAAEEPPIYGTPQTGEEVEKMTEGVDTSILLDLMKKGTL